MSLTTDMISIFKKIHREILFVLIFNDIHSEIISTKIQELDNIIKNTLNIIKQKKSIDEIETKELLNLHNDIKNIYRSLNEEKTREEYNQLIKKIKHEEKEILKETITDKEINQKIEQNLGIIKQNIEDLFENISEYKYSEDCVDKNLFDSMFKIDSSNELLEMIEFLKQKYQEECRLISKVEDLENQIINGEIELDELLKKTGIKEDIDTNNISKEELLSLLLRIIKLSEQIKETKEEE